MLTGQLLKSLSFIWYVTRHRLWNIQFCGHGGHLRSHFQSKRGQMTSNWTKILTGQLQDSLFFIWSVTLHRLWNIHFCGHGGRLRSHFWWKEGQMTSNGYLIYADKLLMSFPFIWYVTLYKLGLWNYTWALTLTWTLQLLTTRGAGSWFILSISKVKRHEEIPQVKISNL